MANLDTQIERTGKILNDIKEAIEGHGLDLEGVSPVNYGNKIKEIATVSVQEFGIRPVILFKRAETNPGKPIGGHWNVEDNSIEGVDGWYLDLEYDTTVSTTTLRTWMTTALFKTTDGSMFSNWTKPIQISGENGKDGARGEQGPAGQSVGLIQYFTTWVYYPSSKNEIIPSAPYVKYNKELGKLDLTGGWQFDTKSPDSVTPSNNYIWWQSMLQYNSNSEEVIVTTPVRISAESTAVEGVTRYYLCKSENSIPQINADGWEVWTENSNISPTYEKPYLFVRDSTKYGNTEINSKPWLLAVYTKGLMDIDLSYACLSSNIEITFIDDSGQSQTDVEMNVPQYISEDRWSQTSEAAISKEGYEFTSDYDYLFCRTIYKYHDGKTDCFYQIVSYYKEAEKAPILYSAGIYNEKSIYTKPDSNDQCPYIYYPKGLTLDDNDNISINGKKYNYFYLKKSQSEEMDFESAYTSGYWKKIDSFEAIYSDIGILKAAEVGNFVFDDKYMFSKFGVDNTGKDGHYTEYSDWDLTPTVKEYEWNGSSKSEYETERKGIAAAIEHGAFVPSASINAVTGESWFANGNAKFYYDGDGDLADGAVAWRHDNSGKTTLYIDGDVKIGTKAPEHSYGGNVTETGTSLNELIASEASRLNLLANSAEITTWNSAHSYNRIPLPILVNAGEKYTFKCESAELLAGTHTGFRLKIDDGTDANNWTPWSDVITFGKNKTFTLTINGGVSNKKAWLTLYKERYPDNYENTAVFRNVSLVKGTTAMATWEDYQGDNGLKNLLSVGETFEGHFTAYTYYGESLPITVNAGEKYTFHIENISMLSGTDSNDTYYCYLDDFNSNLLSDTASGYINQSGFGTVTIREGVSNAKARFLISKNEASPNSATVRIKRMSLVKGTRPMMTWKQNTDYLTNAFKNGTTKISGGLVMAQAVAVTNDAGTVKGMFNGSETFKDATHGTLMLAAGSEGASATQLNTAKTRIYDSGKIVTNDIVATNADISGKITSESGKIGGFTIGSNGLFDDTSGTSSFIRLGNLNSTGYVYLGKGLITLMSTIDNGELAGGGVINVTAQDAAFRCNKGMFYGLRPYTRDISSGDTLTELDHNVFIASGVINLPLSPLLGQTYKIYHTSKTSLTIDGNGKTIRQMQGSTLQADTFAISSQIEVIELVYGGVNWYATKNRWD